MAMIKCPECGKEISDTAKTCTHCGGKLRRKKKVLTKIGIIILIFGIITIIGYCYNLFKVVPELENDPRSKIWSSQSESFVSTETYIDNVKSNSIMWLAIGIAISIVGGGCIIFECKNNKKANIK